MTETGSWASACFLARLVASQAGVDISVTSDEGTAFITVNFRRFFMKRKYVEILIFVRWNNSLIILNKSGNQGFEPLPEEPLLVAIRFPNNHSGAGRHEKRLLCK